MSDGGVNSTADGGAPGRHHQLQVSGDEDDTRVQFTTSDGGGGGGGGGGGNGVATGGWYDRKLPATAADAVAVALAVVIAWCLLHVNVAAELMTVPGGSLASVFVLYVVGLAAGWLVAKIGGLPPLLGMMLAGVALRNTGMYTVTTDWCVQLVAKMRDAALTVILVKGGLELNAGQLRQLSSVVARLTVMPCVAEAVAAGVASHYILPNFSWAWGLTLGFTLSAVSPAVLVPSLFRLKRLGYGELKGINTLLIAASSLDDIVSISAFGVLLGVIFSTGSLTNKILQGPTDVLIGTVLGIIWGSFLIFVPPSPWTIMMYNKKENDDYINKRSQIERSTTAKRSFLLGAGGYLAVTGSSELGYPGAGPLACIISAFVAGTGWRRRLKTKNRKNPAISVNGGGGGDGDQDADDAVVKVFEFAWVVLQPVLFAFIGADLNFEHLKSGNTIFLGLLVLAFGLVIRLIVTTCAIVGTGFSRKEKLFVNIAWLPKATVQAALAPVALNIARTLGTTEDIECATQLVTIAVISILLTAPLGAFGIQLFGPRLLPKSS